MNKVILSGNLTADPNLRKVPSGMSVASGTIAVRREFKENGEYKTDFINYVAWDKQADYLSSYTKKGDKIELCGRWQVREYERQDRTKAYVNEVIIESVNSLTAKPKDDEIVIPPNKPTSERLKDIKTDDDSLPF